MGTRRLVSAATRWACKHLPYIPRPTSSVLADSVKIASEEQEQEHSLSEDDGAVEERGESQVLGIACYCRSHSYCSLRIDPWNKERDRRSSWDGLPAEGVCLGALYTMTGNYYLGRLAPLDEFLREGGGGGGEREKEGRKCDFFQEESEAKVKPLPFSLAKCNKSASETLR